MPAIGVLALQGNFQSHQDRLSSLGVESVQQIRNIQQLEAVDALILPGGESTALLRLIDVELEQAIRERIRSGLPTLATCAGLILLASQVHNPNQRSLDCLDLEVERNAYGRQVDSFICPELTWTTDAVAQLEPIEQRSGIPYSSQLVEGVFIRAPRISSVGKKVSILIEHKLDPVLVRQGNILGATFHPELSEKATAVHALFLSFL